MLQDKRKDLDAEKQKKLVARLVADLSASRPDLYYQSTSEIARQLMEHIQSGADLLAEERTLLLRLNQRDLQVMLSYT